MDSTVGVWLDGGLVWNAVGGMVEMDSTVGVWLDGALVWSTVGGMVEMGATVGPDGEYVGAVVGEFVAYTMAVLDGNAVGSK